MKKFLPRFALLFAAVFSTYEVNAGLIDPKFAIDPASPEVDGNVTPDDVLKTGPMIHTRGTDLGLVDDFFGGFFDNLNALSYGHDPIRNPLYFSVDRVAVGLSGSAVQSEAAPGVEEASGDVFKTLPPNGSNTQFIDEQQLGLTPGFFGSDLDALDLDQEPDPWTYFSIDSLSATNGFGTGDLANDILISDGSGGYGIFAEGVANIGLTPGDDLDALVLLDRGTIGRLDPGIDLALFSLSTFSLSAFTSDPFATYIPGIKDFLSPADVLFTDFTGTFTLWAAAADIGLRPDDELNALDTIPEPETLYLLGIGMTGFFWSVRKQNYKRR